MRVIWTASADSTPATALYEDGAFTLGFCGHVESIKLTAEDAERLANAIRREHPDEIIDNGDLIDFGDSWDSLTKERVAHAQNELATKLDDLQVKVAGLRRSQKDMRRWVEMLERSLGNMPGRHVRPTIERETICRRWDVGPS